jgi:enediyne biosynthesis protein E4
VRSTRRAVPANEARPLFRCPFWNRFLALIFLVLVAGCHPAADNVPASSSGPEWFEDVTDKLGLKHVHDCGPINSEYFLPQVIGSGCAFFDYDGDGKLDVYLIHNGGPRGAKNQLFHQEADGKFRDVSAGSGLDVAGYGMGVAIADVNNDGLPDVLLTEYGATRLFLNLGKGRFEEVTREAGLDNPLWATSAAFFDFDRDGWLDLVVVNYLDYEKSIACRPVGNADFCPPFVFNGTSARLYRNLGKQAGKPGVRFEDVTVKAGLATTRGRGLGVLCADFDGDGWPDIFSANDGMANFLWINQRDGTFKEEAVSRGVAFTMTGATAGNMGVAWADVSGSGLPDLFVTHLMDENHTLWQQGPRGLFQDRTAAAKLTTGQRGTGFGIALVDFDRDGWPDLVFVNGGVRRNPTSKDSDSFWARYAQGNQVYANLGNGKFKETSEQNPAFCRPPGMGRGLAVGDFDNDGAPDLLITQIGGPAKLLRNVAPSRGHWLAVRALVADGKRDAYGAEITVRTGGRSFWRLLNPGYSYCSSNDPRCHFGLGPNDRFDGIDVLWPDGSVDSVESFEGGRADRLIEIRQGQGTLKPKLGRQRT